MTERTRRGALLAAIAAPLGLSTAARATQPSGEARDLARAWITAMAAGQLASRTHPGIVLVLHGAGAGLDGIAERFEGRDAVASVLAGMGPARWDVEDMLAEGQRVAVRGTAYFGNGRAAAFAAFVTLRDGQVVQVERHLDRVHRLA